jgi:hypothetical protein
MDVPTAKYWNGEQIRTPKRRKTIEFDVVGQSRNELFGEPERHTLHTYVAKYGQYGLSGVNSARQKWYKLGSPADVTIEEMTTSGYSGGLTAIYFTLIHEDGSRQRDMSFPVLRDLIQKIKGLAGKKRPAINTLRSRWHAVGSPEEMEMRVFLMERDQFATLASRIRNGKPGPKRKERPSDGPVGDLEYLSNETNTGAARVEADHWDRLNPHGITSNKTYGVRILMP